MRELNLHEDKKVIFSNEFQTIMNNYFKEEKKKKLNFEFMKNPTKIYIQEIYNKKSKIKIKDEDFFNDLLHENKMDFDKYKFLVNNHNKTTGDQYQPENKKISKHLFLKRYKRKFRNKNKNNNNSNDINNNNNDKNDNKDNNDNNDNMDSKKVMIKSLSQNLSPALINFNNIKLLKFPKIFPKHKYNNKIYTNNNLLIKTNSQLSLCLDNNNNKDNNFNSFFSLKKRKIPLKEINKFSHYTNFINKTINKTNKKIYYNKLNSLTNASKKISKELTFYSINENLFINEQIKKTNLLKNKLKKK